jgi:hypothetical protein
VVLVRYLPMFPLPPARRAPEAAISVPSFIVPPRKNVAWPPTRRAPMRAAIDKPPVATASTRLEIGSFSMQSDFIPSLQQARLGSFCGHSVQTDPRN